MREPDKIIDSPSGRYRAKFWEIKREGFTWWTTCFVQDVENGDYISVINRNYYASPYAWVEGHSDGHDYFLFGNDYQGQTVVQLDTGLRRDHIPKAIDRGAGFCWAVIRPDGDRLIVEGCYWACPYEEVVYDFTDPMALPYKELERRDCE